MGVQRTVTVTRKQAEHIWVEQELEKKKAELQVTVQGYDNTGLEDAIEEEFFNYAIEEVDAQDKKR